MENALSNGEVNRFQYYLFDVLYLHGADTTKLPLLQRKELVAELLTKHVPKAKAQRIGFSEHFTVTDDSFFKNVCSLQLEGVLSKRADAPYHVGRSKIWLKTKCQKRQEFVIGGFTLPSTGALGVGALSLGYYEASQGMMRIPAVWLAKQIWPGLEAGRTEPFHKTSGDM